MRLISDVHGAFASLRELAGTSQEPLLILGDFVNFVDYRTGDGIVADVFGKGFVGQVAALRAAGDYEGSRALWRQKAAESTEDVRLLISEKLSKQYGQIAAALDGCPAFVIYGNVDSPELLQAALPDTARFVDGQVVEIEGWRVGFAGGGAPTPLGTPGEVSEADMAAKLAKLGPVDILCTHLPPAVDPLRFDVVVGRLEAGSAPILEYLYEHRPAFHYFGDVHQPRAARWQVASTTCQNVGYFRATRRPVVHSVRI